MSLEVQDGLFHSLERLLLLTWEKLLVETEQADPARLIGFHGREAETFPQDLVGNTVDLGNVGDGHPAADQLDVGLAGGREAAVAQDGERTHGTHPETDGGQQADDDQDDDEGFLPGRTSRIGGSHGDIIF